MVNSARVSVARGPTSRRRFRLKQRHYEAIAGMVFVAPVVLGTVLFDYVPIVWAFLISLTDWNALSAWTFRGLDNYVELFASDREYLESLWATVYFTVGATLGAMVLGMILALLVNQQLPGISFFRAAYFLPVITPVITVGVVWRFLYNPQFGAIGQAFAVMGLPAPDWLRSTALAMPAVIIVDIWQRSGYNMVLLLAGLHGIPREITEAATVDGANLWRVFFNVTLPLLTPTIFFVLIISIISSFQVFGLIYMLTGGGPGTATTVYVYYLWELGFQRFQFGPSAAMAFILFLLIASVTALQWWLSRRWVHYQ